jgi:hypothetical protein
MELEFEKNNICYKIDHINKIVELKKINYKDVFIRIFKPGQEVFDEELNVCHQFPGVASSIVLPGLKYDSVVDVMLNDHTLYSCKANKTSFNYHICNKRLILGTLISVHVKNKDLMKKIYIGAPIFKDNNLVSVVTALHRVKDGEFLMPVTGIRESSQISADLKTDRGLSVEKLLPDRSVYGNKQLPYEEIKQYAIDQDKTHINENACENYKLFYNDQEVRITFNRGNKQIQHWRMPGPLVQLNK